MQNAFETVYCLALHDRLPPFKLIADRLRVDELDDETAFVFTTIWLDTRGVGDS